LSRIGGPIHHTCVCRNGTMRVPAAACPEGENDDKSL
jgi:hypothetical protein